MSRTLVSLVLAGAGLGSGAHAHAYTTYGHWPSPTATLRAGGISFPAGGSYRAALATVVDRWYSNPSNFYFEQRYDEPSVALDNEESEVWFSSNDDYAPAVCFHWFDIFSGNEIDEVDVVFYTGVDYTTSMTKTNLWAYGGAFRPFQTTAMHEYGHALGLDHEGDEYNIMGSDHHRRPVIGDGCRPCRSRPPPRAGGRLRRAGKTPMPTLDDRPRA